MQRSRPTPQPQSIDEVSARRVAQATGCPSFFFAKGRSFGGSFTAGLRAGLPAAAATAIGAGFSPGFIAVIGFIDEADAGGGGRTKSVPVSAVCASSRQMRTAVTGFPSGPFSSDSTG